MLRLTKRKIIRHFLEAETFKNLIAQVNALTETLNIVDVQIYTRVLGESKQFKKNGQSIKTYVYNFEAVLSELQQFEV